MTLQTASLNSGSNGNCYYIGNEQEAVLIDAGLSCRETERRLQQIGLSIAKVKALFISHEHTDHVRGMARLSAKHGIPVYLSEKTLAHCRQHPPRELIHYFQAHETIVAGSLRVTCFPKKHDAIDPYSFVVSGNATNVGVFTDIGEPCAEVIRHFAVCDIAYLEANYDDDMLAKGSYPAHLKKRIAGSRGHLSNAQSLQLFREHSTPRLRHLLLAHLSQHNNCPDLVSQLFHAHASSTQIVIASRYGPTEVFSVATGLQTKKVQTEKPCLLF